MERTSRVEKAAARLEKRARRAEKRLAVLGVEKPVAQRSGWRNTSLALGVENTGV
jgi:hypothetical protein